MYAPRRHIICHNARQIALYSWPCSPAFQLLSQPNPVPSKHPIYPSLACRSVLLLQRCQLGVQLSNLLVHLGQLGVGLGQLGVGWKREALPHGKGRGFRQTGTQE